MSLEVVVSKYRRKKEFLLFFFIMGHSRNHNGFWRQLWSTAIPILAKNICPSYSELHLLHTVTMLLPSPTIQLTPLCLLYGEIPNLSLPGTDPYFFFSSHTSACMVLICSIVFCCFWYFHVVSHVGILFQWINCPLFKDR